MIWCFIQNVCLLFISCICRLIDCQANLDFAAFRGGAKVAGAISETWLDASGAIQATRQVWKTRERTGNLSVHTPVLWGALLHHQAGLPTAIKR